MSFDLTLPLETGAASDSNSLPEYCDICKFVLVEELCLEEDYRLLHYGKCTVIGKVLKSADGNILLENVRVTNLPNEFSLPEGTLNVRLLTFSYFDTQLENKKYVEITGTLVLFNTKNPQANHRTFLTSKSIVEQLNYTKNEEEYKKLLKYFHTNYKPAVQVWFVQQITRADSKQPLFFSFSQVIQNSQTDLDIDLFIKKFQDNFEKEQQRSWLSFWNDRGEKEVLNTWNEKYKDYLKEEKEELRTKKQIDCEKQCKNKIVEEVSETDRFLHEKSWEDLWQAHREEIYYEQYILFTTIYYNYFLNLRKSCETRQSIPEDLDEIEEEQKDAQSDGADLRQELEQLSILGLPTCFGGRPQNSSKNQKSCKKTIVHYSDFYSDSEIENESNDSEMEESSHSVPQNSAGKIQKRKRNRNLKNIPSFILEEKGLLKYWRKRFSLFSRFDEGIRLDRESWFSVTPEKVAKHLADRLKCSIIVDGFCGSGGNVIQFALTCDKVIAIDIDPVKLEMAKHNAEIYKVAHKIEFILGDYLQLAASGKLKADIVFLSPPWGGPKYKNKNEFDIEKYLLPAKASELVEISRNVSQNIALFLPRNSKVKQIVQLAGIGNRCEIEHNFLDSRLVALTALYGDEILTKETTV